MVNSSASTVEDVVSVVLPKKLLSRIRKNNCLKELGAMKDGLLQVRKELLVDHKPNAPEFSRLHWMRMALCVAEDVLKEVNAVASDWQGLKSGKTMKRPSDPLSKFELAEIARFRKNGLSIKAISKAIHRNDKIVASEVHRIDDYKMKSKRKM